MIKSRIKYLISMAVLLSPLFFPYSAVLRAEGIIDSAGGEFNASTGYYYCDADTEECDNDYEAAKEQCVGLIDPPVRNDGIIGNAYGQLDFALKNFRESCYGREKDNPLHYYEASCEVDAPWFQEYLLPNLYWLTGVTGFYVECSISWQCECYENDKPSGDGGESTETDEGTGETGPTGPMETPVDSEGGATEYSEPMETPIDAEGGEAGYSEPMETPVDDALGMTGSLEPMETPAPDYYYYDVSYSW